MTKGAIFLLTPLGARPALRNRPAPRPEEMHEENLANTLDRILAERLREFAAGSPKSLGDAIRWIRNLSRLGLRYRQNSASQTESIARIRSLPLHAQEALRRYFVFGEAEQSICASIRTSPREFRRFLREASGYVLMRRERMPELEQRQPPDRA